MAVESITITLNGVEVSGAPGMTILDLARESGVDIPTLCHHPHLTPSGSCRVCLVEEERSGALLASCVTPIRAGMVVNTRSPRVLERRKTVLKLMLASHPDSCMVCDKGNQCQLRTIAAEMGVGWIDLQRIPQADTIEEVNPFIERDLSKCIMCARCIRADQELVVEGAIDYMNRGFASKPATLNDLPLEKSECTFCGTCVAMCPTGALKEKTALYHGATTTAVDTVCPYCGCGCSLTLEIKDGRIVRVKPAEFSPVNHGASCVKGCYGYDFIYSPERLLKPLVRAKGTLQTASWEQALSHAATELNRIKERYGPDSLAIFGSSKCTNEENYLFQRMARAILGTNNIDNGSRLYGTASRVGLGWSIGSPGATHSLDKLELSDVLMVIGANPVTSAPVVGYAVKRAVKKGSKLLLVDPRHTKLAPFAQLVLKPKVGTDISLLNGMAWVIIKERLFDEEFVARRAEGFAEFEKNVEEYSPRSVETLTGIPAKDLILAARIFAGAARASIIFGNGITQQFAGIDAVTALANLALLTGNTEANRGGIFGLQRENNAQGASDMGSLPDFLPGYQSIHDERAKKKFQERWKTALPTNAGLTVIQMMEQAEAGKLKGMLIFGENPVSSLVNPIRVYKALASLEFLLVTDMFLTETAKLATVVLPAASFAEKEGTFTNFEGRVQVVRMATRPAGESLQDWEIVTRLADKLGHPMPYSSPNEVADEIEEMVPLYQRLTSHDFEKEDLDWVDLEGASFQARHLHRGLFPSGFGRFSVTSPASAKITDKTYPLTLITGSILYHFGGGTRSLMASRLKTRLPSSWVEIGASDAKALGLNEGDRVKIMSFVGEANATIKITDTLPSGTLFMPISFPESKVMELFDFHSPSLKSCAVRLERMT